SVYVDFLLAFLDDRTDPGRRQYSAEPKTAGANTLDERALRDKIDSHFSTEHLLLRFWIESDVTRDRPAHQTFIDELSNAATRNRRVVCDDGEVFLSLAHQFVDHAFRGTDGHEAANHQRSTIRDHGDGVLHGNCFHVRLLHADGQLSRTHTEYRKRFHI